MVFFQKYTALFITAIISIIYIFQLPFLCNREQCFASTTQSLSKFDQSCTFYKWFDPNTNDKEGRLLLKNCSSCHMSYYKEWIDDKHSMSQSNPLFLSIYKQFKKEHANQNGNCSLCHNPEAALDNDFNVNLSSIKSKKSNGISCDFCHKIESIDQNPLNKGVAGLTVKRICKGKNDIRFGPLKDPVQPGKYEELKYNSIYKTSLSCAKCHDGSNGNVQIYSTFTEWINSPAAIKGVQCQSCHMAPRKDVNAIVDNPKIKYKERPYHQIHSHSFLTKDPHEFRKKYVDLNIIAELKSPLTGRETLTVTSSVANNNFGHSFPTGSPMRNAILLIEVKDKNGNILKLIKGPRLPNYAGNLKNKPGKLFAKILSETNNEYASQHGKAGIVFRKLAHEFGIPAQDWWNVFVLSDTRIKANESDISIYEFELSHICDPSLALRIRPCVTITAKLIWRNTWPGLAKLKGLSLREDLLAEKIITIAPQQKKQGQ